MDPRKLITAKRTDYFLNLKQELQVMRKVYELADNSEFVHSVKWCEWAITQIESGINPELNSGFDIALAKNRKIMQALQKLMRKKGNKIRNKYDLPTITF